MLLLAGLAMPAQAQIQEIVVVGRTPLAGAEIDLGRSPRRCR